MIFKNFWKKFPYKRDFRFPPIPNLVLFCLQSFTGSNNMLNPLFGGWPLLLRRFKKKLVEIDQMGHEI